MDLRVEHGTDTHVVEIAVDGTLETMAATIAAELRIDVKTFELWKGDECVRHARPSDADTPLGSTTLAEGDTVVLRLTERHAARKKLVELNQPLGLLHYLSRHSSAFVVPGQQYEEKDIEWLKLVILAEEVNPLQEFVACMQRASDADDKLRVLCHHGKAALLNQPGVDGNCILHRLQETDAICARLSSICLSHGADPNVRNLAGATPLHIATRASRSSTVSSLLAGGACPDVLDANGESALATATKKCLTGLREIGKALPSIEALLKHGAEVNIRDCTQQTPLISVLRAFGNGLTHYKTRRCAEDVLRKMLLAGAKGDAVDADGKSVVMLAATSDYAAWLMDLVLLNGGDPSYVDAEGNSPLHVVHKACTAKSLVAAGADLERENAEGDAPLSAALAANRFEAAQGLLEAGADPYHVNTAGVSPAELVRQAPKASVWPQTSSVPDSRLVPLTLSALMKGKARQADARRCAAALLANVA